MRTRASRIVLVVAGALPLLAEDGHSTAEPDTVETNRRNTSLWEAGAAVGSGPLEEFDINDENDNLNAFVGAAEALHDDSLSNFPSLREHEAVGRFSMEGINSVENTSDCVRSQGRPDCIDYPHSDELEYLDYEIQTDSSDSPESSEQQALGSVDEISEDTPVESQSAVEIPGEEEPDLLDASETEKETEEQEADESATAADSESGQEQDQIEESHDGTNEEQEKVDEPAVIEEEEAHETRMEQLVVDYASKSAGALILEKSPNFTGTSNLLNGDRDKYAMTPCSEKKFIVISLSEDIQVKQVKLANFELYSSRVKEFQILGSQTTGDWVDLGTYEAKPSRDIQSFDLIEPSWARYLMFRFLTHYGDEHYCTISQIMVHGSTMIQGFHEHWESEDSKQDDDERDVVATYPTEADEPSRGSGEAKTSQDRQPVEDAASETKGPGSVETTIQPKDEDQRVASTVDVPHSSESPTSTVGRSDILRAERGEATLDNDASWHDNLWHPLDDASLRENSKSALLSASISRSSTVLSTFIGNLDPLILPSLKGVMSMYGSNLESPLTPTVHVHKGLPNRVGRLQDESAYPSMDPALVQFLTEQSRALSPLIPLAEGEKSVGQTLTEKLVSNLNDERLRHAELPEAAIVEKPVVLKAVEGDDAAVKAEADSAGSIPQQEETPAEKTVTYEDLHDTDLALERMLQNVPSAECLKELDYAEFKARIIAAKKGAAGVAGNPQTAYSMEPIFKKLTDEIKALQLGLSVHDQFTKASVACYQRVLLDVIIELQTLNMDHELRLAKLERDLSGASTVQWAVQIHHFVTGFVKTSLNLHAHIILPLQESIINEISVGSEDMRVFVSRVALTAVMIVALSLFQFLIPSVLFNLLQLWRARRRREGSRRLGKIQKVDSRSQVSGCGDVVSKKDKLESSHLPVESHVLQKGENEKATVNSTIYNQNEKVSVNSTICNQNENISGKGMLLNQSERASGKGLMLNQSERTSGNSTTLNPTVVLDSERIVKELGGILSAPGMPLSGGGAMRSRGQ